ncbi:leucine-rich repeat-containing protein kinase family protein [Pseudomonas typographi]|uniref:Serine/threonine-protein kinase n=1 Tax=Pseudomonas typographi TaxID=2715964 RepID=A0ABR7Z776_9PSED|nr:leucine-rich repeat-containing protein kinase family protein [Pseudomonas typographi]MBD1553793.1 serine/threonine-protein kinase [Pseudomonas typographi]MBD1588486.1 serine/threonine-protein kinase [Pseudomonas typographi]MBD1601188.1 serine/threonine-protein kinase [Pseudomonas typographi]
MDTLERLEAGDLAGATRLDLACGLRHFPQAAYGLAETLEVLNLSGNALSDLPHDLHRFKRLKVVFCSNNAFTHLPEALGGCPQLQMVGFKANRITRVPASALPARLRWLILTDNQLSTLPSALGERASLQKLMLAGNRLAELPQSLAQCERLELLRIASNRLAALPGWLTELPALAWLAYAGNPLLPAALCRPARLPAHTTLAWGRLALGARLGEGASGEIVQARLDGALPVAVKLYKGQVTSDGSPLDEMAASLAAGQHPALIPLRGQLQGHPEGREGLVMDLVDRAFVNLAAPPSLASCSRDVYPPGLALGPAEALRIAKQVASLGAHLHARGIMHGDLYAHNLLWRPGGDCLLGDFGAASFHAGDGGPQAQALERLEVRAFGILLGELLHCSGERAEHLKRLAVACIGAPAQRPRFIQLADALGG